MFTFEDIQALVSAFPPEKYSSSSAVVLNATADGVIGLEHVRRELHSAVKKEHDGISAQKLAQSLNIALETLFEILDAEFSPILTTRDRRTILTEDQKRTIVRALENKARESVVNVQHFLAEADVFDRVKLDPIALYNQMSPSDTALSLNYFEDGPSKEHAVRYIYSQNFADACAQDLAHRFDQASMQERKCTYELQDSTMPMSFIKEIAQNYQNSLVRQGSHPGNLQFKSELISYAPHTFLKRQAQETLQALKKGECTHIKSEDLRTLQASCASGEEVLKESDIMAIPAANPRWVVSRHAYDRWLLDAQSFFDTNKVLGIGHMDIDLPKDLLDIVRVSLLEDVGKQTTSDTVQVLSGPTILASSAYDAIVAKSKAVAVRQADSHWAKSSPQSLNLDEVVRNCHSELADTIVDATTVRRILAGDKVSNVLRKVYNNAFRENNERSETLLRKSWYEHVAGRPRLFKLGVEALHDTKLQEQLTEDWFISTTNYNMTAFLDAVKDDPLMRQKHLKLKIAELMDELGLVKSREGLTTILDQFEKEVGIKKLSDKELEPYKQLYAAAIVRRIGNYKDGAKMFTALIHVKFAQYKQGMCFATGKRAPRLLKQLREHIDEEQYRALEVVKDKVKAGSITEEDLNKMKQMVEKPE